MRVAAKIGGLAAAWAIVSAGAAQTPPAAPIEGALEPAGLTDVAGRALFVGSESMRPTLWRGDYPSGQSWSGSPDESLRGRIVVFVRPGTTAADWVSRVIGLPGEHIGLRDGIVSIDGRPVPRVAAGDLQWAQEPGRAPARYLQFVETLPGGRRHRIMLAQSGGMLRDITDVTVPPGHVFVLSDNRDNALDSRMAAQFGTVPAASIRALVDAIVFSLDPEISLIERAAAALFLAHPPAWYPPRNEAQWREATQWRAGVGWGHRLRLERAQVPVDAF